MLNVENIPVAHKLIWPGNPAMKARAAKKFTVPSHLEELNSRIDDIENAIGQKTNSPVGRAFAIRAEKSCDKDSDASIGHLYPKNHKTNSSNKRTTIKNQELV